VYPLSFLIQFIGLHEEATLNCYPNGRTLKFERRSVMPRSSSSPDKEERRLRGTRLGFRVDSETKRLVKRAAALERRSLTDYCLTALTTATRETFARHQSLVLSERDRAVFFDALVHPPAPNDRLRRAFRAADAHIVS
jgi:uncharacterized protein (DUF1778 family)